MNFASRIILLVDDNPDDAELFRRAFQKCQFENPLHAVSNGDEAINYLRGEGQYANRAKHPMPYLLLLDPNMPGKSGWEVLQWVRNRREFEAMVVLVFGGDGSPREKEKAQTMGANGYHPKPAGIEELEKFARRIGEFWLMGGAP